MLRPHSNAALRSREHAALLAGPVHYAANKQRALPKVRTVNDLS